MLILSHADVEAVLPMAECIEAVDQAMRGLSRGDYFNPLRMKAVPPDAPNRMVFMPALRASGRKLWSNKQIVVTPGNSKRGLDSHQGGVLLHDGDTGELLAMVHAGAITAIRTAAASAVATRALARALRTGSSSSRTTIWKEPSAAAYSPCAKRPSATVSWASTR